MSAAVALAAPREADRERREFTRAMRAAVQPVSVVTTDGAGGRLGLTVSALASVSAEPAMLLVCIARRSPLVAAIHATGVFGVNVLGEHQAAVAETFAGRNPSRFDFGAASWAAEATARGFSTWSCSSTSYGSRAIARCWPTSCWLRSPPTSCGTFARTSVSAQASSRPRCACSHPA